MGPKWRGAVFGVLAGLAATVAPAAADVEREAALEAYHLAMEAYAKEAVEMNASGEKFLCGYGIVNRSKTTRAIDVDKISSLASWHTGELVCAEIASRELVGPVPAYGLSGFELGFKDKSTHKLNALGVTFQSRALERVFRRQDYGTVPLEKDLIGEGEIQKLRLGRKLIPLAWKLRLADEALKPDSGALFGGLTPMQKAQLQMLQAYFNNEADPNEDAYRSYKDRLFPAVFEVLDQLGYAYFDGPSNLAVERIAKELFLLRYLNHRADGEKAFQLATEAEKVSLVSDMIRQSDIRRAMTLLTKLEDTRDQSIDTMPVVYSHFRDVSGKDPITDKISYVPLNWDRVREAARPVDEDWSDRFLAKAKEATDAGRAMRLTARRLRGEDHTQAGETAASAPVAPFSGDDAAAARSGDMPLPQVTDIKLWDAGSFARFSSGRTGLTSPEAQAALANVMSQLTDLQAGLAGKLWADGLGPRLDASLAALTEVRDLEQDNKTQERLATAIVALEAAGKDLAAVDGAGLADRGALLAATRKRVTGAIAGLYDLRGQLYEGHAVLFKEQTTECSQTCEIIIEPPGFEAELVLSGFYVGHTGNKATRLSELSIEPGRSQGFDVLRVAFRDADGYENNTVFLQYAYVPRSMIANGRAAKLGGKGTSTARNGEPAAGDYRLIQSFSVRLDPEAIGEGDARDVMIEQFGIRNTSNQTRVLLRATGKDDADVTDKMVWEIGTVDVDARAVTRPASAERPYVWPFKD